jgi:endonuclease/exonuclease/phosphatase family metal-dependent hydrolase
MMLNVKPAPTMTCQPISFPAGSLAILAILSMQMACAAPVNSLDPTPCQIQPESSVITAPYLSVLTLNLAHGRKVAFNQMFQKSSETRRNLDKVARFISNSGAHLVAFQEADFASRWSGKFNHVEFISQQSPYPCRIHAHHAKKYMYDFGTALLSSVPYTHSLTHTFEPSPPTTNKGFVMGEVLWNPDGRLSQPVTVSVISVHLDFSRKKVREAQTEEMRTVLPELKEPVIILGDFNADWNSKDSAIKAIVADGKFKAYQPEATHLGTYKSGKHRLDWILISKDLEFVTYEVPQIVLSDHQPIQATLKLVDIMDNEKEK